MRQQQRRKKDQIKLLYKDAIELQYLEGTANKDTAPEKYIEEVLHENAIASVSNINLADASVEHAGKEENYIFTLLKELNFCSVEYDQGDNESNSFKNKIAAWMIKANVSRSLGNELLHILKEEGHEDLPSCMRTLISIDNTTTLIDMPPGKYHHFGLEYWLRKRITSCDNLNTIELSINVDGLPIFNSSIKGYWPILGAIVNKEFKNSKPFPIGIFYGKGKPNDEEDFLKYFIEEFLKLKNSFQIFGKKIDLALKYIVCDAPAKSFILCTKYFNAYHGCTKCTQKGTFLDKVVFLEMNSPLRTDDSFRNKDCMEYHRKDSPLLALDVGLVSQVPLDYMHLVCLGVTKKLLNFFFLEHETFV